MKAEHVRAHVWVTGRVQGVWFRASTVEQAQRLDLNGWVLNLADGRVEAVAEGPREAVDALVTWLHQGPPLARVDAVDVAWEPVEGESAFDVRRRG